MDSGQDDRKDRVHKNGGFYESNEAIQDLIIKFLGERDPNLERRGDRIAISPLKTRKEMEFIKECAIDNESTLSVLKTALREPTLGYIKEIPAVQQALCLLPRLQNKPGRAGLLVQIWHPGSTAEFAWGSHLLFDMNWTNLPQCQGLYTMSDSTWKEMVERLREIPQVIEFAQGGISITDFCLWYRVFKGAAQQYAFVERSLLETWLERWPKIEFANSEGLGGLIQAIESMGIQVYYKLRD